MTLKEHLRVMYEDGNWYASHTLQFIGVALMAVALVALARSGAGELRQAQRAGWSPPSARSGGHSARSCT